MRGRGMKYGIPKSWHQSAGAWCKLDLESGAITTTANKKMQWRNGYNVGRIFLGSDGLVRIGYLTSKHEPGAAKGKAKSTAISILHKWRRFSPEEKEEWLKAHSQRFCPTCGAICATEYSGQTRLETRCMQCYRVAD